MIRALRALQRARGIICGSAQGRHEQQYKIDDERGGVGCPHEKEKRKEKVGPGGVAGRRACRLYSIWIYRLELNRVRANEIQTVRVMETEAVDQM